MKLHSVTDPPDVIHIYMIILQVLAILLVCQTILYIIWLWFAINHICYSYITV